MEKIFFALSNGVSVHCGDKRVVSTVDSGGQKRLKSFVDKNKILFWHFPFARGLEYFFCGILAYLRAMFEIAYNKKEKKYITKLFLAGVGVLAVIFSAVVLGLLPAKLGYWLVDYRGSTFCRNLSICGFKIAIFYVLVFCLRVFPSVSECFRFNKAIALSNKQIRDANLTKRKNKSKIRHKCTKNEQIMPNFLQFLIFVFVLDFIVVTLVGASFGFLFNFLFHLAVFLVCISIAFEIVYVAENTRLNKVDILQYVIGFLVFVTPSTTHFETVAVAIDETNLLCTQKGRELMDDENKRAFSVVYLQVKNKLAGAGITDKSDADWIIATVLGKNRAEIKLVPFVTDKQYEEIMNATERRANGESVDNIFGFTEFYGLRFDVNKKVLTPRMETEILVEQVLKAEKNFKNAKILDLGTGSGAIAVALAKNCGATITALDVSKTALATAEANAKKNGVKIEFICSNLFDDLKRKRKFDIIVSNPPYIPTDEIEKLDKNVKECDPILALDGGDDGLDFYREITKKATDRLCGEGMLFYEVGKGQASAVRKILKENGFVDIKTIKDYNKIERVVYGKRK